MGSSFLVAPELVPELVLYFIPEMAQKSLLVLCEKGSQLQERDMQLKDTPTFHTVYFCPSHLLKLGPMSDPLKAFMNPLDPSVEARAP